MTAAVDDLIALKVIKKRFSTSSSCCTLYWQVFTVVDLANCEAENMFGAHLIRSLRENREKN
jgi:hypothetical protein